MQYKLISDTGAPRLILIFAGWGMDDNVFAHIVKPGYDVMVLWNYSSFHIDWTIVEKYHEICIVAWSMGVFAATETTHAIDYKVTRRIAINGTTMPVNNEFGIPEAIFTGTLNGLSEQSVRKFYRRMCYDNTAYQHFQNHAPTRDIDSLHAELEAVLQRTIFGVATDVHWDLAIIGKDDKIFPRQNQRNCWNRLGVTCIEIEDGHYIDIESIVNKYFVDKSMAGQRFGAAVSTYESQAAVQADAIDRLMNACKRLGLTSELTTAPDAVLEIGSGSGLLTRRLCRLIGNADFEIWDLAAPCPTNLPERLKINFSNCDAEIQITHTRTGSLNFIFTASTVQWFNSPALFFKHCARALAPAGVLALTTYTVGNMHEISDITGISLPLLSPEGWESLAGQYFDVIHSEAYERDLDFDSPIDVLRHLKATGVNSLSRSANGEIRASDVIRRYPMRLDGRYHLTYKPYILILRKK